MPMSSEADKNRFWSLARRYIELGQLLPPRPTDDAGLRTVLTETNKTKNEMDILLDRNATK